MEDGTGSNWTVMKFNVSPQTSAGWSWNCCSASNSSELTLASFITPALEEADDETGSCSVAPVHIDYYWEYKNKICVSILGYGLKHLTTLFKILETCPSASHAKQLKACNKTKYQKKSQSVLCWKMLCNILTRMLNSSVHRLFSEKTVLTNWNHAQCNLWKYVPKVVSLPYNTLKKHKCLMFSDTSCQTEWCLLHGHNWIQNLKLKMHTIHPLSPVWWSAEWVQRACSYCRVVPHPPPLCQWGQQREHSSLTGKQWHS